MVYQQEKKWRDNKGGYATSLSESFSYVPQQEECLQSKVVMKQGDLSKNVVGQTMQSLILLTSTDGKETSQAKTSMNFDEVELQTIVQHFIPIMLQKTQVEWEACHDQVGIPKEQEFLQHVVVESIFAVITRCLLMLVHSAYQSLFHTGMYFFEPVNGFP